MINEGGFTIIGCRRVIKFDMYVNNICIVLFSSSFAIGVISLKFWITCFIIYFYTNRVIIDMYCLSIERIIQRPYTL